MCSSPTLAGQPPWGVPLMTEPLPEPIRERLRRPVYPTQPVRIRRMRARLEHGVGPVAAASKAPHHHGLCLLRQFAYPRESNLSWLFLLVPDGVRFSTQQFRWLRKRRVLVEVRSGGEKTEAFSPLPWAWGCCRRCPPIPSGGWVWVNRLESPRLPPTHAFGESPILSEQ